MSIGLHPSINGNRKIIVSSEPSIEPVTYAELTEWAHIDGDWEEDTITAMIVTARKNLENYTKRTFINTTLDLILDCWPGQTVDLPLAPVSSISSVSTLDESDTATTYSSSNYYLSDGFIPRLVIKKGYTYPLNTDRDFGGYKITYVAGYGATASSVPQAIRDAIKIWATYIYENRNPNPEPPKVVKDIISTFVITQI